jgi:hypothetical protein
LTRVRLLLWPDKLIETESAAREGGCGWRMNTARVKRGSGTTLIASEHADRICYGMELDPKYCDVIVARWEKLTGRKAELKRN